MIINNQIQIPCPQCHQSDRTILMEDLYFSIIEGDRQTLSKLKLPTNQTKKILREIRPPALDRLPIWLIINPDILVSIVLVVILILTAIFAHPSRQTFLNNLIVPAILVVAYLFFRKKINTSVSNIKIIREHELRTARIAADHWSSYFVCLRDQVVFSGHNKIKFPISETQARMFSDFVDGKEKSR